MRDAVIRTLFALTLITLAYNYTTYITSEIAINYNEGIILDGCMRLLHGINIYPHDISRPPYLINNYGPLYFLLQLPFLAFSGPTLLFGSIISITSHLMSALFAGLIIRHLTGNNYARIITSLLVLASPLVGGDLWIYRVDLLAQSLSLAGIYIGITSKNQKRDICAALLFVAAIYTKLTYALAGPATVFLFLWLQGNRKHALRQGLMIFAISTILLAIIQWMTDGGFLFNIVTSNVSGFSFAQMFVMLRYLFLQSAIGILLIPRLLEDKTPIRSARLFCGLYCIFSIIVALASSHIGANLGYFSEFQISIAFIIGTVSSPYLNYREFNFPKTWFIWLQTSLYLFWLVVASYGLTSIATSPAFTELKKTIQTAHGLVLADNDMGLVALAGKPIYSDPLAVLTFVNKGMLSQEPFLNELRNKKFSLIIINTTYEEMRWTPEILEAIKHSYYLEKKIDTREVWKPRLK